MNHRSIKHIITMISILLMSTSGLAKEATVIENIIVFNNAENNLSLLKPESKEKLKFINVLSKLINPVLLASDNQRYVSVYEHFGDAEDIVDLNTGVVEHKSGTIGSIILPNQQKLYFTAANASIRQLVFESKNTQRVLTRLKALQVPRGHMIGNHAVSWFIRAEHTLIIFDLTTQTLNTLSVNCSDAVYLGKDIFCFSEPGKAIIIDMQGNILQSISNADATHIILGYAYDRHKLYFTKSSLSLALSSFLNEVLDLYSYDLTTGEQVLEAEHVTHHGGGIDIVVKSQ